MAQSDLLSKDINDVYVVAVNDIPVINAWKENIAKKLNSNENKHVHFLSDASCSFTKALGMDFDATALLGNHRSKRYVALVNDNVVTNLFVENSPADLINTRVDTVLQQL